MVKHESKTDKQSSLKALIYQGFLPINGRLAQLVAHPLDVREVTSSSLVSSTKKPTAYLSCRFYFCPEAVGLELVTLLELEPAQADQAAKVGRAAAGLHKFESCIVHQKTYSLFGL